MIHFQATADTDSTHASCHTVNALYLITEILFVDPSFTSSQFDGRRPEQIFKPTFDSCIFHCHLDLACSWINVSQQTNGSPLPYCHSWWSIKIYAFKV